MPNVAGILDLRRSADGPVAALGAFARVLAVEGVDYHTRSWSDAHFGAVNLLNGTADNLDQPALRGAGARDGPAAAAGTGLLRTPPRRPHALSRRAGDAAGVGPDDGCRGREGAAILAPRVSTAPRGDGAGRVCRGIRPPPDQGDRHP